MYTRKLFLMFGLLVVFSLSLVTANPSQASSIQTTPIENKIPVAALVKPDGTLDLHRGVNGSLDVVGWNVTLDPQRGPVFTQNSPAASGWSGLGNGLDGTVLAVAVSGSNVYVGGYLTQICGNSTCDNSNTIVNHIAQWNGSAWSALGHGVDGVVYTIAVRGDDVFVGGYFSSVCSTSECLLFNMRVNNIAVWNGSSWAALGNGLEYLVYTIAVSNSPDGAVYAGGEFTQGCGNPTCNSNNTVLNRVAKFSSGVWSPLNHGVGGSVFILVLNQNALYVGGAFDHICATDVCDTGTRANSIGRWYNGAWTTFGNGVNDRINGIAFLGTDMYIAGDFTYLCGNTTCSANNIPINYIARWDGAGWHALGNGLSNVVWTLASNGTDLFVGGNFNAVCGNPVCNTDNVPMNHIAKWNGTAWSAIEHGVNNSVNDLALSGNDVVVGGTMKNVCADEDCNSNLLAVNYVAKYTASTCNTKPAAPQLVKPANTAQVTTVKVKLDWNDVSCATKYKVRVKQDTAQGKTVFKKTVTTSKVKTTPLEKTQTYLWMVKACNASGCAKSATFAFSIKP